MSFSKSVIYELSVWGTDTFQAEIPKDNYPNREKNIKLHDEECRRILLGYQMKVATPAL